MLAGRGSLFDCLISGADPVWPSGHEAPCTARGKAARIAAVAELHDGNAPEAPAPAEYRNGAGGTLGQTEAAPVEAEATQEQETASTARTQATQDAAASRPASAEGLQDSRTASGAAQTGGGRRTGRTA